MRYRPATSLRGARACAAVHPIQPWPCVLPTCPASESRGCGRVNAGLGIWDSQSITRYACNTSKHVLRSCDSRFPIPDSQVPPQSRNLRYASNAASRPAPRSTSGCGG
ncbi:hypothetical protein [Lysobacter gummosus]|uniref:hypothetical protein n=1 Tax=Lysobacter gummosus TaxID=262324 RepID=UPI00362CA260